MVTVTEESPCTFCGIIAGRLESRLVHGRCSLPAVTARVDRSIWADDDFRLTSFEVRGEVNTRSAPGCRAGDRGIPRLDGIRPEDEHYFRGGSWADKPVAPDCSIARGERARSR
jgi:hypothetical protein